MHIEHDYTMELESRDEDKASENSQGSGEDLPYYLEYCKVRSSQYTYIPSEEKRERVICLYGRLKKVAFICRGKISLDVGEARQTATLIFWSPGLCITNAVDDTIRNMLVEMIRDYPLVYIDPAGEGVGITLVQELFDEVMVTDRNRELEEIVQKLKDLKNHRNRQENSPA